jgi:hypothetical protein
VVIALLLAVAGCGLPEQGGTPAGRSDTRQVPSTYEPGVHITGYVNVGVARSF